MVNEEVTTQTRQIRTLKKSEQEADNIFNAKPRLVLVRAGCCDEI